MPNGFGAVIAAMLTTMFTFMGTEIVTIAAAESPDPEHGIRKAVNSVIWRISLFYLGSIFVVVSLVAWNSTGLVERGSYQTVLDQIGLDSLATGARPGHPHRGRVLPELRALHRLPYGVLALQPR